MNFASNFKTNKKSPSARVSEFVEAYFLQKHHVDFALSSGVVVAVEVQCNLPDCVPVETMLVLVGKLSRFKAAILKPIDNVTLDDVFLLDIPLDWDKVVVVDGAEEIPVDILDVDNEAVLKLCNSIQEISLGIKQLQNSSHKLQMISLLRNTLKSLTNVDFLEPHIQGDSEKTTNMDAPRLSTTLVSMKPNSGVSSSSISPVLISSIALSSVPVSSSPVISIISSLPLPPTSTQVTMTSNINTAAVNVESSTSISSSTRFGGGDRVGSSILNGATVRHNKGVRQRGCPCCDPDNLDNIVDKILFLETPP